VMRQSYFGLMRRQLSADGYGMWSLMRPSAVVTCPLTVTAAATSRSAFFRATWPASVSWRDPPRQALPSQRTELDRTDIELQAVLVCAGRYEHKAYCFGVPKHGASLEPQNLGGSIMLIILFVIAAHSTLAYKDKAVDVRQVGRELAVLPVKGPG
jgi:hypothetical protein